MTEQLMSELFNIIKSTKDFVLDQAPDIAKQMILIARIESVGIFFICFVMIFAFYRLCKLTNFLVEEKGWDDVTWGWAGLVGGITLLFLIYCLTDNLHNLITSFFAPKVYLLETLSKLIKK